MFSHVLPRNLVCPCQPTYQNVSFFFSFFLKMCLKKVKGLAKHLDTCAKRKQKQLASGVPPTARQFASGMPPTGRQFAEEEEQHACQFCDYRSRFAGTLRRHMKHVHNVEVRRSELGGSLNPDSAFLFSRIRIPLMSNNVTAVFANLRRVPYFLKYIVIRCSFLNIFVFPALN
jgi:hypothetical protein